MSTPTSPAETTLPQRSSTLHSTTTSGTRRTSMSDDEAIPDSDTNEVCTVSWGVDLVVFMLFGFWAD